MWIGALYHTMALRRAPGVRALGAARAHVLHAHTRATASRPWPLLACRATPVLVHTSERSKLPPGALQRRRQSPLAARRRLRQAPAMDGAARATAARQLASGAVQAYPRARPLVPVAATSSCRLQNVGSPILSPPAAEPTSTAYIRSPRARPGPQAASYLLSRAPTVSDRREEVVFLTSDRFGRRHTPVKSGQDRGPNPLPCSHPPPLDRAELPSTSASIGSHRSSKPKSTRTTVRRGARRRRPPPHPPA